MKTLLLGVASSIALFSSAFAATSASPLMGPVHQFADNFNKGDLKAAMAAFAPGSISIIDEVAPFTWTGPGAVQDWAQSLTANDAKAGITNENVTLGALTRSIIEGDRGYAVVAVTYSYKQKGKAMREPASMVFSLVNGADGWKINGWTWTGTVPQPVGK